MPSAAQGPHCSAGQPAAREVSFPGWGAWAKGLSFSESDHFLRFLLDIFPKLSFILPRSTQHGHLLRLRTWELHIL